jgi:acetate kinase
MAVSGSTVLALNSGSSSLKFGLYRVRSDGTETLLSGKWATGDAGNGFRARESSGNEWTSEASPISNQQEAIDRIAKLLAESGMPRPDAIGHRIVHGGPKLHQHCLIDEDVMGKLEAATAFAPVHIPPALSVIRFARKHFTGIPEVACFDTTFHADLPEVARVLPIPKDLQSDGVRRYGFHGLSCESIVHQLADKLPNRVVIAHLGNGASVTAVRGGQSVDTSMGLSPTGGVIMSTRTGDLDPGVLLYLMREKGFDAVTLEDLVDHRSGLLGISGISGDIRCLHAAAASNRRAHLAIEMFGYSVRKQVAAMMAALGGVDLIVFTGGIGENDSEVRSAVCEGLSWAGVSLDNARNKLARNPISDVESSCAVLVLESQEDEQIARHADAILGHTR